MKGRLWNTKKLKWSDVYEPKHTGHKFFFQNAFLLVRRSDERLSKHQTSAMYERELSNENNCLLQKRNTLLTAYANNKGNQMHHQRINSLFRKECSFHTLFNHLRRHCFIYIHIFSSTWHFSPCLKRINCIWLKSD